MDTTNYYMYEFYTSASMKNLVSYGDGAIEAYDNLKKSQKLDDSHVAKFSPSQLPPKGFSLLSLGNGLSVAYRISVVSEKA